MYYQIVNIYQNHTLILVLDFGKKLCEKVVYDFVLVEDLENIPMKKFFIKKSFINVPLLKQIVLSLG